MAIKVDLVGKKFKKLVVIKWVGRNKYRQSLWLCKCDCGNLTTVAMCNLTSGNTNSCGCYNIFLIKKRFTTHKLGYHKLYSVWNGMKRRCYNKDCKHYKNYGGRGITVCKEWLTNPRVFFDWSLKNGYKEGLTLDRNDNNGNYSPENCSFKTRAEQNRNHRRNVKYKGECAVDASRRLGGGNNLIKNRIKLGWSLQKAFNTPLKEKLQAKQ